MKIDILTLFPEIFILPLNYSILKRAQDKNLVRINICNTRDFTKDKHKKVDDYPYGGGSGMIMKIQPIYDAINFLTTQSSVGEIDPSERGIILLSPQGAIFNQKMARDLSLKKHLILICGHYEGVDERVREHLVTEEISIGDYILTGGELAAMVVTDAVVRLIRGVLGSEAATQQDSFSDGRLEYPQYTRPKDFMSWKVPEILFSGNHKQIESWRKGESIKRTLQRRPDLIDKYNLSEKERESLE